MFIFWIPFLTEAASMIPARGVFRVIRPAFVWILLIVISSCQGSVEYLTPYNLSVTEFSLTTITLDWECNCGEDTQYQLWYWPVNASMDLTMTVTKTTSYVIRNLEPGQLYSVWLLAAEGNLTSDYVTLQHRTSS